MPARDRDAHGDMLEVLTDDLLATSRGRRVDGRGHRCEARTASSFEPTDRILWKARAMKVLVWSDNRILSDLVARNLGRRGFDIDERPLPPAAAPDRVEHGDPDLVIVDLDCLEPELWRRAARLRTAIPGIPLVILGHAWPTSPRLHQLQPCTYVRKPFAIDELLAAVQDAPTTASSPH